MSVLNYNSPHQEPAEIPQRAWACLHTGALAVLLDGALYLGVHREWFIGSGSLFWLTVLTAPAAALAALITGMASFGTQAPVRSLLPIVVPGLLLAAAALITFGTMVVYFLTHLPVC
jgi:hypothetical protein